MWRLTFPEPRGRFHLCQLAVCQLRNVTRLDMFVRKGGKLFKMQTLCLSQRGQGFKAVADDPFAHGAFLAEEALPKALRSLVIQQCQDAAL